MAALRLGDDIDDYCVRCHRLTNHLVVSFLSNEPAKVRCRSCYSDHNYLKGQVPPSKKELRKAKEEKDAGLGPPRPGQEDAGKPGGEKRRK